MPSSRVCPPRRHESMCSRLNSVLLQRGIQDRNKLSSIPEQLFHVRRYRRGIFTHFRTRETRGLPSMRRRVPRNFHSSGLDSRAPNRNASRKTGHVRTRLSGLCCIYRPSSQIKKPSLSTPTKNIYLQAPPQLEAATRANLEKKVSGFVPDGGLGRRGNRYRDVTPVQPLVMHQILYTQVVVVNCISYRINHKVRVCGSVSRVKLDRSSIMFEPQRALVILGKLIQHRSLC
jgi:hypothetical protein